MNAAEIKQRFTRNALFSGYIVASESNYAMKPDLLTISKNLRTCEYEIKVSIADLRKELTYIEAVLEDQKNHVIFNQLGIPLFDPDATRELNRTRKFKTYDNKYRKHRAYQFYEFDKRENNGIPVPNRFYFLISRELYEKERERIDAIPFYGVIDSQSFLSLKRCKPIHNELASAYEIWQSARNIQFRHIVGDAE
ncbi:hypothetical protein [Glutamicibacter halophytocola]|uniref:hypothetical protein n=1 Tax=Glutamicibacter halophytocola TaxID=1933880 RepID=UPI0015C54C9E|nr:hypothetical protein [Glutamicibacter halophytocola]NQD42374.1 hypothetical protein [Glutamicibacter halophytocola]